MPSKESPGVAFRLLLVVLLESFDHVLVFALQFKLVRIGGVVCHGRVPMVPFRALLGRLQTRHAQQDAKHEKPTENDIGDRLDLPHGNGGNFGVAHDLRVDDGASEGDQGRDPETEADNVVPHVPVFCVALCQAVGGVHRGDKKKHVKENEDGVQHNSNSANCVQPVQHRHRPCSWCTPRLSRNSFYVYHSTIPSMCLTINKPYFGHWQHWPYKL
mmetsp:Transcript_42029/g.111209  ORF Transcript_42029/g.111209 Transcript_42029/m.111209 type:complete len:215 (+) Transcript_42029:399-1043(+)